MCRAVCWSCVRCSSAMPERAPRRRERYDPSTGDRMEFVRAVRVAVVGFPWGEMYPPCTDTYLCASVQHGSGRMAPSLGASLGASPALAARTILAAWAVRGGGRTPVNGCSRPEACMYHRTALYTVRYTALRCALYVSYAFDVKASVYSTSPHLTHSVLGGSRQGRGDDVITGLNPGEGQRSDWVGGELIHADPR